MAPAPHLRELIDGVLTDTGDGDVLAQLAVAAETANELTLLGDKLLGHYVENARNQGHSWIEISETLGVSKQAVHKRFSTPAGWRPAMDHFTERARSCIEAAEAAAAELGHNFVGTEHLLLGLYAEPESIAGKILVRAGIDREQVEQDVRTRVPAAGSRVMPPQLPYTPKAAAALERTLQAALTWGHNYVGTEHLLVGLYGDDRGVAAELLVASGLPVETVKAEVVQALSGYQRPER